MDASFRSVSASGWRLGLSNLFKKERREWLEARRWVTQTILWLVIVNGLLSMILFVLPNMVPQEGTAVFENPVVEGTIGFFSLGALAFSTGIIILTQNEIIGEKLSGTAEWVLSKPVSRAAFFLSKLFANTLGMLVVMILLQCMIAYLQIQLAGPGEIALFDFLVGALLMALHVFFYLSLTLMMGVFAESREMVLGVPIGVLLVGLLARNFIGPLAFVTPWLLPDISGAVAAGEMIGGLMWLSVISTTALSLAFIGLALWRFERYEF